MLESFALAASVLALVLSALGIYGSIRFYRDALELQLEAKTILQQLHQDLGIVVTRTLDAALSRRFGLTRELEALEERVDVADGLLDGMKKQLAGAKDGEVDHVVRDFEDLLNKLKLGVQRSRAAAEEPHPGWSGGLLERDVVASLDRLNKPASLDDIAELSRFSQSLTRQLLAELSVKGLVRKEGDLWVKVVEPSI